MQDARAFYGLAVHALLDALPLRGFASRYAGGGEGGPTPRRSTSRT